ALGERITLVGNAPHRDMAPSEITVRNMIEETECEWVVQRPVLAELFPIIAALDAMQHREAADVGAVEQIAVAVKVEAPRVAPAFAEQLEAARERMVAPDALLKLHPLDMGGHGASLAAVKPTIRPPGQRVGHRVGVLHAEARDQHIR